MNPVISKKPSEGYNLWAADYDNQPDNLILRLDEKIFYSFLQEAPIRGSSVADIGCGTGRHWEKILSSHPQRLAGFDVSEGMLGELKKKWPGIETYLIKDERLPPHMYGEFDIVISTLTLAHINNPTAALTEWGKLLKSGGEIILTDYHPDALRRNAKRTFKYGDKTISLESFVYPIETIRNIAKQLGWAELRFTERRIDETVKSFYKKQNAIALYNKFYGMPLIYGIHLKKSNDTL